MDTEVLQPGLGESNTRVFSSDDIFFKSILLSNSEWETLGAKVVFLLY